MFTSFRRIFSAGATTFSRSGVVSFATVLIMTATLVIIGTLMLLLATLSHTLLSIQDKVDVNVYFKMEAQESDILSLKSKLETRPDIASVTYKSRDETLQEFRARHADDQLALQALELLGENPLLASLSIKATDPSKYEGIVNYLSDDSKLPGSSTLIQNINYFQNKNVIDKLIHVIAGTRVAGIAIALLFAIASIIITFATVRLAIYSARDEIAVMRLVGASNWFIRGPFIVAGVIGGVISAIIALVIFWPVTWYAGQKFTLYLGGFNLFTYYTGHFPLMFVILVGSGILLGGIASFVAVRRYLNV